MKLALKDFQTDAVRELLSRLDTAKVGYRGGAGQRQAVGLTATTGAGKTIIATAVIEAILFGSIERLGNLARAARFRRFSRAFMQRFGR